MQERLPGNGVVGMLSTIVSIAVELEWHHRRISYIVR